MALELSLEENEQLLFDVGIKGDRHTRPIRLAVSDKAVFILREKHFSWQAWYIQRVPLKEVRQVFLSQQRGISIWIFSFFIFAIGAIVESVMMYDVLYRVPGARASGYPLAMVVAGILIPILAKGRKILVVQFNDGVYRWKPQLMVDRKHRNWIKQIQVNFVEACKSVGVHVLEDINNH